MRARNPCPIPPRILPPAELDAIAVKIAAGARELEDVAIAAVAAAIWGMAGRLSRSREDFREDLFVEGLRGCVGAFRGYDGRSHAFTYACARAWGVMRNLLTIEFKQTKFLNHLPDDHECAREDPAREVDARLDLQSAIHAAGLTAREVAILAHRHGLDGTPPLGLRESGRRIGISHARVSVSERRAISKIRSLAFPRAAM